MQDNSVFRWLVVLFWSFRFVFVVSVSRFGRSACFGGFVSTFKYMILVNALSDNSEKSENRDTNTKNYHITRQLIALLTSQELKSGEIRIYPSRRKNIH